MLSAKEARKSTDDFKDDRIDKNIKYIRTLFKGIPARIQKAANEGNSRIFIHGIIIDSNVEKEEYYKHIEELETNGYEVKLVLGSGVSSGKYTLEISW